jgi:hypothetical protein
MGQQKWPILVGIVALKVLLKKCQAIERMVPTTLPLMLGPPHHNPKVDAMEIAPIP